METFQPYLSYLGIGLAGILGLLLLVWIIVSVTIFLKTKGLPQAIRAFFTLIVDGNITGAYQLTTDEFKAKTSKKEFTKFIKKNKLNKYSRNTMSIPTVEGNRHCLEVTAIAENGQEIPLKIALIKNNKDWQIADLKYNYQATVNQS